jgi:vesicle coat complex subunit
MWNKFLSGVANNPQMTKKEICHHLRLKFGTINSIQRHYKLQSPFYFKKQRVHKKKNSVETSEVVKPNKANMKNKNKAGGGDNYDFDETFNKTVKSLKK